eukprot:TRINITY_DN80234_c0_g1_i1.p1 TRINITY_DN80234_c0_g1~~TRINITY_DN80234_c0_g1_i1.p1  ORF type:complete len:543 (+),score=55.87 TRINITY_DN80234_c0_g1_i1:243-1871(+)
MVRARSGRFPPPRSFEPATAPPIRGEGCLLDVFDVSGTASTVQADKSWSLRDLKLALEASLQVPFDDQQLLQEDGSFIESADQLETLWACEAPELTLIYVESDLSEEHVTWKHRIRNFVCPEEFQYSPEDVRSHRGLVMLAVSCHGRALRYASDDLQADRAVVLTAIKRDAHAMEYAAPCFFSDPVIASAAVKRHGGLLRLFSEDIRADRTIVKAAVDSCGYALEHVAETFKADTEIVQLAVQSSGSALKFAAPELQADRNTVLMAVRTKGGALEFASEDLRDDRGAVLAAIARNAGALAYASVGLRGDPEVVMKAVPRDITAFRFASKELQENRQFVLDAIGVDPRVYTQAEQWWGNAEFLLEAVQRFGDKMLLALLSNGFCDLELLRDRAFVSKMLSSSSLTFRSKQLCQELARWYTTTGRYHLDDALILSVVRNNPAVVRTRAVSRTDQVEFWQEAYRLNPKVRPHIPKEVDIDYRSLNKAAAVPLEPRKQDTEDDTGNKSPEEAPTNLSRSAAKRDKRAQREKQRKLKLQAQPETDGY